MKTNEIKHFTEAKKIHRALMTDENDTPTTHSKRLQRFADIAKENGINSQLLSDICWKENNK